MCWVWTTHFAVIAVQDELEAWQQIWLLVDIIQCQSCCRHARLPTLPSSFAGNGKDTAYVQLIRSARFAALEPRWGDQTKQKYPKRNSTITCHILLKRERPKCDYRIRIRKYKIKQNGRASRKDEIRKWEKVRRDEASRVESRRRNQSDRSSGVLCVRRIFMTRSVMFTANASNFYTLPLRWGIICHKKDSDFSSSFVQLSLCHLELCPNPIESLSKW